MSAVHACVGIGANLGDAVAAVRGAMHALAALPQTRLLAASRLYRTAAWGRVDQPDFVNAAALLETRLAPRALLEALLEIERQAGRSRQQEDAEQRWGPRVLDLDLLLYGQARIDEPGLCVPHPYLHQRAFVLVPLMDVAPQMQIPGYGSVADARRCVQDDDVRVLDAM
jgi:2-amino-4-hydroxy-6-hydroxymethyldihydropteridine diphosphokinase